MKLNSRYLVALFPLAVVAAYTGNMFHCQRQADYHEREAMFFDERLNPKGPSVAHQYSSGSERDGDYGRMSRHFRLAANYREAAWYPWVTFDEDD